MITTIRNKKKIKLNKKLFMIGNIKNNNSLNARGQGLKKKKTRKITMNKNY